MNCISSDILMFCQQEFNDDYDVDQGFARFRRIGRDGG